MRTLYLLGAGASASESNIYFESGKKMLQYIPTVASFPTAINFLLSRGKQSIGSNRIDDVLGPLNPKLKESLGLLLEGTKTFGTPDTYAKSLLLKYGPKSSEYWYTKMAISFVIQAIQIITSVDPRYYQFFSALLNYNKPNEGKLHDDVFIATWNYDLQLNESLTSLLGIGPKEIAKSEINFHGIKPEKKEDNTVEFGKKIFRINGYAGSVIVSNSGESHQDFSNEVTEYYDKTKSIDERMNRLIEYYNSANAHKNEFFINFAWDDNEASRSELSSLESLAETIECLVVIGYSFPVYNREIDMRIIRKLKSLVKVYVQDKIDHTYKIKEYIRAAHFTNDAGLEKLVKYEYNCDQFLVPNELYAESKSTY